MLLTSRQMSLIETYEKGRATEEEKQEVLALDKHSFEFYGEHLVSVNESE